MMYECMYHLTCIPVYTCVHMCTCKIQFCIKINNKCMYTVRVKLYYNNVLFYTTISQTHIGMSFTPFLISISQWRPVWLEEAIFSLSHWVLGEYHCRLHCSQSATTTTMATSPKSTVCFPTHHDHTKTHPSISHCVFSRTIRLGCNPERHMNSPPKTHTHGTNKQRKRRQWQTQQQQC